MRVLCYCIVQCSMSTTLLCLNALPAGTAAISPSWSEALAMVENKRHIPNCNPRVKFKLLYKPSLCLPFFSLCNFLHLRLRVQPATSDQDITNYNSILHIEREMSVKWHSNYHCLTMIWSTISYVYILLHLFSSSILWNVVMQVMPPMVLGHMDTGHGYLEFGVLSQVRPIWKNIKWYRGWSELGKCGSSNCCLYVVHRTLRYSGINKR